MEAIALGHDLGHTPFGHAGEATLHRLHPGGFRHNEQSLRVVDILEREGQGLNLTIEVRDGILKHSKGRGEIVIREEADKPLTREAEVVRVADVIAYINHDIDDAIRGGVITLDDLPGRCRHALGDTHSAKNRPHGAGGHRGDAEDGQPGHRAGDRRVHGRASGFSL